MLEKIREYVNTEKGKYIVSCIIASLITYNLVPILGMLFPNSVGMYVAVLGLLIINPIYVFVSNLIISEMNKFDYKMPIIIGLLFTPSVFAFYNSSALVYVIVYIGLGFIASMIGNFFYKRAKK